MKACPFCAEQIQDAAVVCKHCGRSLIPSEVRVAKGVGKWGAILATVVVLGFLGFIIVPMLWQAATTGTISEDLGGCRMNADTIDGRKRIEVRATYDFKVKELALNAMPEDFSPKQAEEVIDRCTDFLKPKLSGLEVRGTSLKFQTATVRR